MTVPLLLDQALAHHGQGRLEAAEDLYRRILAMEPQHLGARHMLGVVRAQQGRFGEAHDLLAPVVAATPHDAQARVNFANVLNALGRAAEALGQFDRAVALAPDHLQAQYNRGKTLHMLARFDEALAAYDRALALAPDFADAWNDRGLSLQAMKQMDPALASFRRALALRPDMPEPHLNLGFHYLLLQDFARGWQEFEWRKRMPEPIEARNYAQPLWTGTQDIQGKTLFAYIEQGFGDGIQYHRFLDLVLKRGARVVLSVPDRMIALLKTAPFDVELIGWGHAPAAFDYHIPLASITLATGMAVADIPAWPCYLSAEPARVARWKDTLGGQGFRIAIAWQGNQAIMGSEGKSFPVAALAHISRIPGVRLISLQKNAGAEELDHLPGGMAIERYSFDEGPDAFLDSAAIMENCELVIACDTSLAHLAGALGVPCWMALKYVPDWRWFLDRADSPWYPSVRLFRQPEPGDWEALFSSLEQALVPLVRSHNP
jgi:tetratricopeptide (TPR) repeat protein